jgi:hypothetical protein
MLVLKLRCNKRSAYIETQAPPSSKKRPHFETRICIGENKNLGQGFRGDWSQERSCWLRPASTWPTDRSVYITLRALKHWGTISETESAECFPAKLQHQTSRIRGRCWYTDFLRCTNFSCSYYRWKICTVDRFFSVQTCAVINRAESSFPERKYDVMKTKCLTAIL